MNIGSIRNSENFTILLQKTQIAAFYVKLRPRDF